MDAADMFKSAPRLLDNPKMLKQIGLDLIDDGMRRSMFCIGRP